MVGQIVQRNRDQDARAERRFSWANVDLAVVAITVVALVLRLWALGAQSLWNDEWLTALAADGGLRHLYHYVTHQAGIPPTFFALVWGWTHVVGTSEWTLRLPSAIAGAALVPVVVIAARAWGMSRTERRVAALLVTVNPMLIWYSQEARPYSLVALAVGVSLVFLPRWIDGARRVDFGAWAFACALAVALHYYAIFLIVLEAAYLLWRRRPRRSDLPAILPAAAVGVMLLPFAVVQTGRRENHAWISQFDLSVRVRETLHAALLGPGGLPHTALRASVGAGVVLVVLVVVGRWVGTRQPEPERSGSQTAPLVLLGFGFGAVVLMWVVALLGVDGFLSRYLIGSLVALSVALPCALRWRPARPLAVIAVGVLVVVGLVASVAVWREPTRQRVAWRQIAAAFEEADRPGDAMLFLDRGIGSIQAVTWYLPDRKEWGSQSTVRVTDIDVLRLVDGGSQCDWFVGRPCGLVFLGRPLPAPFAHTFVEVDRVPVGLFEIVRYRAAKPTDVHISDLKAGRPGLVLS